jgi:transposase InsO family protein
LKVASVSIEAWRRDYNEARPHGSLRYLTPNELRISVSSSGAKKAPYSRF